MKRGKKGQFYLVSAIIIIVILLGVATISNYTKKKENVRLYDLKDELGIEGGEVIEYGVYNNKNELEDFTRKYSDYAGAGKSLIFVYGDENELHGATYTEISSGEIAINIGSDSSSTIPQTQGSYETQSITSAGNQITVTLPNGNQQTFNLKEGQNFFFIISQEVEGETYVATSN
jgi:hypothetical protein